MNNINKKNEVVTLLDVMYVDIWMVGPALKWDTFFALKTVGNNDFSAFKASR